MTLVIHIFLALTSILFATYSAFSPTKRKLHISYLLTLGTLVSAGVLTIQTHTSFGHACLSGLAYLGLASIGMVITKKRLATQSS